MSQDYLAVTIGSLAWFGDAVFPGCPRQTGHWKTHQLKCVSADFRARNGAELFCSAVLVSAVAGFLAFPICASCSFTHSCLLKDYSSAPFAACSGYCLIWVFCAVFYVHATCSTPGVSGRAASTERGTEWVSSADSPSLGRKQTCMSGKENLFLTFIREHESLNLPNVFSSTAHTSDKT